VISETKAFSEIGNFIRKKFGLASLKILPNSLLHATRFLRLFGVIFPTLKMINKANIMAVTTNTKISNAKLKQHLNFEFLSVEKSLEEHLQHYIQDNKPNKQ